MSNVDISKEVAFTEWFRKNYPGPDTIIHKPDWHAPKIYRAATRDLTARIAELEAENAILRTEKHADAEAIGALLSALTEIRDWRKSCHDHDKDMGHDPREFDVEDLKMVEFRASAAIKGVTNV